MTAKLKESSLTTEPTDSAVFVQAIYEADIDWIVTIELNSNPEFRDWLGQTIFGFDPQHDRAWRSVAEILGESDLIWRVSGPGREHHLALIENKIDAVAQPDQQERYQLRGEKYVESGVCADFCTVLISPEAYSSSEADDYDHRISYEKVREFFAQRGSERDQYLVYLFTEALTKLRTTPSADPDITRFRRQVWELAQSEFPHLGLDEPGPCREKWVIQRYGDFKMNYKMYSKASRYHRSVVDIELSGQAYQLDELVAKYADDLVQLEATGVTAGASAAFQIEVPCAHPPDFDEQTTRAALEAWDRLLTWWQEQRENASHV